MKEVKEIIDERLKQIRIQIGDNIEKARIAAGFTAKQLGNKIGVTEQQIFKYEKGKDQTPSGRLVLIAEALRIDVSILLHGVSDIPVAKKIDVRTRLCTNVSRNFAKIKDANQQNTIHKIIKELADK